MPTHLVLNVSDNDGYFGKFLGLGQLVRASRQDAPIGPRSVAECDGVVAEEDGDLVCCVQKRLVVCLPQAFQLVLVGWAVLSAGDALIDGVEHGLRPFAIDRVGEQDTTAVHDARAEQRAALVRVVAVVQRHLVEDAQRTGALTPKCHLGWVAAERGDVIRYPLEGYALVTQTQVRHTGSQDLFAREEAEPSETVVGRYVDDGLAQLNATRDNDRAVVGLRRTDLETAAVHPE